MQGVPIGSNSVRRETPLAVLSEVRAISGPAVPTVAIQDEVTIQALPPSFEYGQETEGPWDTVDTDAKVLVGDTLRITYRMGLPFLEDWQTRYVVSRLNADSRFELRHVALNEEIRRLTVEVRVLKPFSPAILVPIAIIAVLAGATIWLTTQLVEKLIVLTRADDKQSIPWFWIAVVGAVGVVGVFGLSRLRAGP